MYDLLKAAQPQVDDESDVAGWALFDKSTKKQYGQIEATKDQVLQDIAGEAQPAHRVLATGAEGHRSSRPARTAARA